jgi:transcriptional regulator GlxA family with amidase domain
MARAASAITRCNGTLSSDALAARYDVSRQEFARRFRSATGLSPKLFGRLTRFQRCLYTLLSTDVSRWAAAAVDAGFYDQAHMVNEFQALAGASPTRFFQPHGSEREVPIKRSGRPSEWATDRSAERPDPHVVR